MKYGDIIAMRGHCVNTEYAVAIKAVNPPSKQLKEAHYVFKKQTSVAWKHEDLVCN